MAENKIVITNKSKVDQRVKYSDIVEIKRVGNKQKKTVTKQTKGIAFKVGETPITEKEFKAIQESPWFVTLAEREDLLVDGKKYVKPVAKPVKK